ncbi:MAG: TIGR03618 family F420-dependent PPOX class oxidoreductase [Deltaproteobacteria bacterium]|nr:TIGR03618 family F420-dependent PPOX class oxidoreductase [Deltaproteobacteria bacterium]
MATPLPEDLKALLDGPNFAHLATLRKSGAPQVDPVWVGREGDRVLIGTGERTVKAKNSRRDPRVALSIIGFRNPYDEAMVRGRVVEWRPDPDLVVMDEISRKYTGKNFPWRSREGRVTLVIETDDVKLRKLPFEPPA